MNRRAIPLGAGLLALGIGVVAVLRSEPFGLGVGEGILVVFGALALLHTVLVVRARRRADRDEATTTDPELAVPTPAPGESLDRVLRQFPDAGGPSVVNPHLREGLRSVAATVLAHADGETPAEARERVAAGEWTDDDLAAGFLDEDRGRTRPSFGQLVRRTVGGESLLQRQIRVTVDAIADAAGIDDRRTEETGRPLRVREGADPWTGGDADVERYTTAAVEGENPASTRSAHPTGHWRGVRAVALAGIGVGVVLGRAAPLLAGAVGVGYAAYARSDALPPGPVAVDRRLADDDPEPGDPVEVTLAVTNEGDRPLADVRVVDGVPPALAVADGTPRLGTALRPGETATVTYAVTARRGVHEFRPVHLVARDLPGATEAEWSLPAATTLTCYPSMRATAESLALRAGVTRAAGRVETDIGGSGVEFHATREYRPGDALSRIDWHRRARTGELTTVEFREERAATVVLAVDARTAAYLSPDGDAIHAVDRSVAAASRLYATLTDDGNRVGLAGVSSEACWLAPGAGPDHRVRARELLGTHPAFAALPSGDRSPVRREARRLEARLPRGAQVVYLTSLCDNFGVRFARRLDEVGHPVTVVSPDPTAAWTSSHRLERVARILRASALRTADVPVLDWGWDEPLDAALARQGAP